MDDAEILRDGYEILRNARTSALKQRVEVITRGARRNWRPAEKREIVLASLEPGALPSVICREHGIGSGQLSLWRQQFREGRLGDPFPPVLNFAQAVVEPTQTLPAPEEPLPKSGQAAASSRRQKPCGPSMNGELIEIALPNSMVVRVGADVDQAALERVLAALKNACPCCPCCRGEMHRVGESRAEMLDILPAQLRVKVIRRPRYICQACDTPIVQAPAPPRPIDGGMATEALIAHVLASKFADHLPLYRQARLCLDQITDCGGSDSTDRSTVCARGRNPGPAIGPSPGGAAGAFETDCRSATCLAEPATAAYLEGNKTG